MVHLPVEAHRHMDPHTDIFSPGYFSIYLTGGQTVRLNAGVNTEPDVSASAGSDEQPTDNQPPAAAAAPFESALKDALKAYIVRRGSLHTIIAGYPWFLDWGRDTLIVIRGLIAAGYLTEAEAILMQFASFEENGTLPNMISGNDASNRDTSDAPLWFFVACDDLMKASGNRGFIEKTAGDRRIIDVMAAIAKGYIQGTPNGIKMDAESGLIYSPSHFTWMDTNHPAGSPRQGYPIEIQALWHFALRMLAKLDDPAGDWSALAEKVQSAIEELFVLQSKGYLSDCLHADSFLPAAQAEPDDALRPNQLFAVTLGAISDPERVRGLLDNCLELLVPGAIRSLADRPVSRPLAIRHNGQLLNDPYQPYQGIYTGDEDTRRKPAYHNGTAWTWVFPAFCEAWAMLYGASGTDTALSWLTSSSILLNTGCAGQIPEILDGDAPHTERGCDAQGWGVSELLRVWQKLTIYSKKGDP
jgi:predicted glycogen debranching enzyme